MKRLKFQSILTNNYNGVKYNHNWFIAEPVNLFHRLQFLHFLLSKNYTSR